MPSQLQPISPLTCVDEELKLIGILDMRSYLPTHVDILVTTYLLASNDSRYQ